MSEKSRACEHCIPNDVVLKANLAYVRYDNRSLSRGHVLVIPRRHVSSFFDTTIEEQHAVLSLMNEAKNISTDSYRLTATILTSTSEKQEDSHGCMFMSTSFLGILAMSQSRKAASGQCSRRSREPNFRFQSNRISISVPIAQRKKDSLRTVFLTSFPSTGKD